jgi:hypothetical protein
LWDILHEETISVSIRLRNKNNFGIYFNKSLGIPRELCSEKGIPNLLGRRA